MKRLAKVLSFFCLSTILLIIFATPILATAAPAGTTATSCGKFSVTGDYCLLTGPLGSFFTDGKVHIKANGLSVYLNTLYKIGVAVATGLALIFITIGGVKYASTDAIGGHEEGIKYINNALFGLVLVVGSYVMLNAINPDLLKSDLPLQALPKLPSIGADTTNLNIANDGTIAKQRPVAMGQRDANSKEYGGADASEVQFADAPGSKQIGGGGEVAVDFDGSPGAYKVAEDPNGKYIINGKRYSSVGYEDLANAGTNGNWWGVKTDSGGSGGNPVIGPDGTLTGVLSYGTGKINGDYHAFVALNSSQVAAAKQSDPNFKLGSNVILTSSNGTSIYATYADFGGSRPSTQTEASPAALTALGVSYGKNSKGQSYADGKVTISLP